MFGVDSTKESQARLAYVLECTPTICSFDRGLGKRGVVSQLQSFRYEYHAATRQARSHTSLHLAPDTKRPER
jgi:hypothetical protein